MLYLCVPEGKIRHKENDSKEARSFTAAQRGGGGVHLSNDRQ